MFVQCLSTRYTLFWSVPPQRRRASDFSPPKSLSENTSSEGREDPERQLDEEQERRIRLQLYVFVVRCIAYPFNAKQPTDMARRQQKGKCPVFTCVVAIDGPIPLEGAKDALIFTDGNNYFTVLFGL
ncbi:calcium-dependent secretion activator 2 isoform 1 [Cricetulus griseus]|nr:calcium-dependent secretion activator 2 isoform 1 [Cricetulus griseus]